MHLHTYSNWSIDMLIEHKICFIAKRLKQWNFFSINFVYSAIIFDI